MKRFIGIVCAGLLFFAVAPQLAQATSLTLAEAGVCTTLLQPCGVPLLSGKFEWPPAAFNIDEPSDGSTATTSFTMSRPTIGSADPTLANPFGLTSMDAFAVAGSGSIGASASASSQAFVPGGQLGCAALCVAAVSDSIASFAYAELDLSDVIISGPAGTPAGTLIPISLNLSLSGTIDGLTVATPADFQQRTSLTLNGLQIASICGAQGAFSEENSSGITNSITTSGVLTGFPGAGVKTPTCDEPVGTPFGIFLAMQTQSYALIQGSSDLGSNDTGRAPEDYNLIANARTDFANTLSFNTGGAVFNLPTGYTANSIDGGIVNNEFTLPGAPVPEPGSLLLFGTGLLGVVGVARRKWLR